jgi:hypothetical protein
MLPERHSLMIIRLDIGVLLTFPELTFADENRCYSARFRYRGTIPGGANRSFRGRSYERMNGPFTSLTRNGSAPMGSPISRAAVG